MEPISSQPDYRRFIMLCRGRVDFARSLVDFRREIEVACIPFQLPRCFGGPIRDNSLTADHFEDLPEEPSGL